MAESKNILLTRPLANNHSLGSVLRKIGHQVLEVPLVEIVPVESVDGDKQLAREVADFDDFVFISQHSVNQGVHIILENLEEIAPEQRVIAVGRRTARELRKYFARVFHPEKGVGGEALMATEEMADLSGRKILIIRGANGKAWLGDEMRARGAQVEYFDCYKRRKPRYLSADLKRVLRTINVDVVFLHSVHAAANMLASAGSDSVKLRLLTAVVGSRDIKRYLTEQGWKGYVVVAPSPSNFDMLERFSQFELKPPVS